MKGIILTLLSPFMAVFALAGCQTIEWCTNKNIPVPWQAWALLAVVTIYIILCALMPQKEYDKIDRFFKKLEDEE